VVTGGCAVVVVVTGGCAVVVVTGGSPVVVVTGGCAVVVVVTGGAVVVVTGGAVVVVTGGAVVVVTGGAVVVVTGGAVVVVGGKVVVGAGVAAQPVRSMSVVSSVTAPLRASSRPSTSTPVFAVIEVSAMTVPTNVVPVPRVAELPTCQNTLHASAPLISATVLFDPVISVESAWKIHTELGSLFPSRVSVPVRPSVPLLYTPSSKVCPPSSTPTAVDGRPAALLYAIVRSAWACAATASAECWVPSLTRPGGNPVIAVPGLTPRSPAMFDGPVLVTVEPASTAKLAAVPSGTGAVAACAVPANTTISMTDSRATRAANTAPRRRRPTARAGAECFIVVFFP
jgi:hypothetical protein